MKSNKVVDVNVYFNSIKESLKREKIVKITNDDSYSCLDFEKKTNQLEKIIYGKLYLIFESGKALIIDMRDVENLNIEYRLLSENENNELCTDDRPDFFNEKEFYHDDFGEYLDIPIHERRKDYEVSIKTEYDYICEIIVDEYNHGYYVKYENGDYVEKIPEKGVVGNIRIELNNGVCFDIYHCKEHLELWNETCIKVTGCKLVKKVFN